MVVAVVVAVAVAVVAMGVSSGSGFVGSERDVNENKKLIF